MSRPISFKLGNHAYEKFEERRCGKPRSEFARELIEAWVDVGEDKVMPKNTVLIVQLKNQCKTMCLVMVSDDGEIRECYTGDVVSCEVNKWTPVPLPWC